MAITLDTPITLDTGFGHTETMTLGEFDDANGFDTDELQRIVADLTGTGEHIGGGGAAPFYTVRLVRVLAAA